MRSLSQVQPDEPPVEGEAPMRAPPLVEQVESPSPRGPRILVLASLVSLAWAALATATIVLLARYRGDSLDLPDLAALSAGVAAPLAAIWLAALTIARVAPGQARASLARIEAAEARMAEASLRTRSELESIDQALLGVATRADAVRSAVSARAEELMAAVAQLESRSAAVSAALSQDRDVVERLMARLADRGAETQGSFARLVEALPDAEARTAALAAALAAGGSDARAQVAETETLLSAVWARSEAARQIASAETAKLVDVVGGLEVASDKVAAALEGRASALEGSVERALSRTEGALDQTRTGVEAQAAALAAGIEQARLVLGQLGTEADRMLTARLSVLGDEAERLAKALAEQEARSNGLLDTAERGFGILDAKLAHAAQTTGATLDRIDARVGSSRDRVNDLIAPLGNAQEYARQAEAAVEALGAAVSRTSDAAGPSLAAAAAQAASAAEAARRQLSVLKDEIGEIELAAGTLLDTAPLDAARHSLAASVEDIGARLGEAKVLAGEVEASATTAAGTAATRLVDALNRVHEVSTQAEGAMRRTLEGVIAEAREALASAGDEAMRGAFADPIKARLGEVEASALASTDAARAASERLSRQLISLVELASVVEGRIAEADAKLDTASQTDMAKRASMLLESLNSSSIDIAKALSNEVPDTAWASYLRGDRGIFTRRAVKLIDRGAAKAVARRFEVDSEFRDGVQRYIHDFESLLRRATAEREGGQLAITLVSSEVGRLYVALSQALERFRG